MNFTQKHSNNQKNIKAPESDENLRKLKKSFFIFQTIYCNYVYIINGTMEPHKLAALLYIFYFTTLLLYYRVNFGSLATILQAMCTNYNYVHSTTIRVPL